MFIRIYKGEKFYLTPNFTSSEVFNASHPNQGEDFIEMDNKVIKLAQLIRSELNVPVYITSSFRNVAYNNLLPNSSKISQHLYGKALDLKGQGVVDLLENSIVKRDRFFRLLVDNGLGGIGLYDWGVHIDTKEGKFRTWDYRTLKKKSLITSIIFPFLIVGTIIYKFKKWLK